MSWVESLPLYLEFEDLLVVHAGVRPDVPLQSQDEHDLMWIRDEFFNHPVPFSPHQTVVFGHTVTWTLDEIEKYQLLQGAGWIAIDTGAGTKVGWLSALDWDNQMVYQVQVGTLQERISPLDEVAAHYNLPTRYQDRNPQVPQSPQILPPIEVTPQMPQKPYNPIDRVTPINSAVARHAVKDRAMGALATQFIGMEATAASKPSSTRNYRIEWERLGLANTGIYDASDIVMVSGSGPWRGVTPAQIEQVFQSHYIPLLERVIAGKAAIVVGTAAGIDQMVIAFMQSKGYALTQETGFVRLNSPVQQLATLSQSCPPAYPPAAIANTPTPIVPVAVPASSSPSALAPNSHSIAVAVPVPTPPPTSLPISASTPSPQTPSSIAPGINIYSGCRDLNGLGAALTNPTCLSRQKGSIKHDYPVQFRYVTYLDAESAFQANKNGINDLELMKQIINAKLLQHPKLKEAIDKCGGVEWLERCQHFTGAKTPAFQKWEGKGRDSLMIQALIGGYELTCGLSQLPVFNHNHNHNNQER